MKTASGLTRDHLMKNARGKIVSKKQHLAGKKNIDRLKAHRFVKKVEKKNEDKKTTESSD